tara:strand:- start:1525 stop:1995 length:471 start_codon:yes stop_codon:yes gene_type:complete
MQFQALIKSIGEKLGMPNPRPDETGVFIFKIDEATRLKIKQNSKDPSKIYLYTAIAHLPSDKKECRRLLGALLWANLFAQGTNGAVFAADRKEQMLYFCRTIDLKKTKLQVVFLSINDLVAHVDSWRDRIATKNYFVNYDNPMANREVIGPHWKRI